MSKFLRASFSFAWLELKALTFFPVNGLLSVIRSFVSVGIWFFVSMFLNEYASAHVQEYGGDFVAYMVVGVLFFQNAGAILTLPISSLNTAYWDKRLEVYHSQRYGLWAYITGKLLWQFVYNAVMILVIFVVALTVANVQFSAHPPVFAAIMYYLVFSLTCFGFGLVGASSFYFLEVKSGNEPITWTVGVLARIFSGVYYPTSIIPAAIGWVSALIPHTYALYGIRNVMINGRGFSDSVTLHNFLILLGFCVVSLALGIIILQKAIDKADRENGVGIVA